MKGQKMNKPELVRPERMELTSMDVAEEKREELRRCVGQAFPEVFAEGSIDSIGSSVSWVSGLIPATSASA
jgi:hypothetical protein